VLIDAADGATLLVVGRRGHGGVVGLLLGSVARACTEHAPCPVVVVPPAPSDAPATGAASADAPVTPRG
jgi:nucleotide-binding universal stress UspA family protein